MRYTPKPGEILALDVVLNYNLVVENYELSNCLCRIREFKFQIKVSLKQDFKIDGAATRSCIRVGNIL